MLKRLAYSFLPFALLLLSACGSSAEKNSDASDSPSAPEPVAIENSGKTLSGDYLIKSIEDGYAREAAQDDTLTTFKFSGDGAFKIERRALGVLSVVEEGSYLISTGGELVLYVEKSFGEPRNDARLERYPITEQSGNTLRLQSYPSKILVLERQ